MPEPARELTARQQRAILALLACKSVADAAVQAKVSPRQLFTWLKEPAFEKAYRAAMWEAFGQTLARLTAGATAAVDTLAELCTGAKAEAVRVRAAKAILEFGVKGVGMEMLGFEIKELEQEIERDKRQQPAWMVDPMPFPDPPADDPGPTTGPLFDDD
jgi:hypothetical protein